MPASASIQRFQEQKRAGEKIVVVTAYDYPGAKFAERAGVDAILVGDSLGMVVLGYDTTVPVTMEEMLHHVRAVCRAVTRTPVIADMPFMSYQASEEEAIRNAGRLLKEGGAHAVKLEGGERVASTVRRLVEAGIPVMGHLGMTPQSVRQLGGFRVQGKRPAEAQRLREEARMLEQAGAFSLVLELVPAELARAVTADRGIPTIGIGAGPECDGQVQVFHDLLGFFREFLPRHSRRYADLGEQLENALRAYVEDVRAGSFPSPENSITVPELREALEAAASHGTGSA
jgi:3-methyl-2-oxobutanoate hydroxymethyltransferase